MSYLTEEITKKILQSVLILYANLNVTLEVNAGRFD
jgi:hypothetical protein